MSGLMTRVMRVISVVGAPNRSRDLNGTTLKEKPPQHRPYLGVMHGPLHHRPYLGVMHGPLQHRPYLGVMHGAPSTTQKITTNYERLGVYSSTSLGYILPPVTHLNLHSVSVVLLHMKT